ncbi:MAG: PAS domain S-box protein [Thermoplasmatota archaeon]
MTEFRRKISFLMLGKQGGENRIKILELLRERSYNLNQLANTLDLNYRTIKHHIEIMLDYGIIESSEEGYGQVYFISPRLEENYDMLKDMKKKLKKVFNSPQLYEKVVEQTHEGVIILDENKNTIFLNKSAKKITGYKDEDIIGKSIEDILGSKVRETLENDISISNDSIEKIIDMDTKSGENRKVILTMNYFYLDGKEHKGYSILMMDVTKEIKQEEILNALKGHSKITFAYLDRDFDILYANSNYIEKTNHDKDELIGKNHFDIFPNEENERIFREVIEDGNGRIINDKPLFDRNNSDDEGISWALEPYKDGGAEVKGLILSRWNHPEIIKTES